MSALSLDKNNKRALWAAIAASGTDDLNVMFLAFSMSSIISDLGVTGTQGGWIATITNLGMLFGGLLFGLLADKYHKFKVFKWTILIFSVATGLIYFTKTIEFLYLMRFIAGIGVGGEYGVAIAIMAGLVPAGKMGRISSLNGIAGQVGSIVSALLAGWLAPALGWRGLFLFGLAPILLVIWMMVAIDDDKIIDNHVNVSEEASQPVKISELFKTPALTGQTLALMVMTTVQIAGYFGMMNWLPTIIQASLHISVKDSSLWMVSTIVGMCLGMLTFGHLLDTFGPRLVYSIFLLLSSVCVYLFQFANSMSTMLIGGAIVGFFVNGMFAGYGAMITRLYPHHIRSTANNLILNVGRAVGGFSSVIIGSILDAYGVSMVMLFLSLLYLISFVALWTIKNVKAERYQALTK
ncbi:TPA: MFS transporter [Streptococcus equi subsp. zooepidemicus]|uniref:MFS transporter n=1 Tax=Streptococcus equi TaxID=1336 RepID=UPI001E4DFE04|nr:MFS transporter [Streptococcus equi]UFR18440.1 MFS transporter [Streptococcus equi subsp. zooepidemicus]HEL0007207.1 MFS transporter [Streptococcus equi subsp. zooepidemicus]HEL0114260.1 MFS transporter [Streptococcus equi subsp. zooepidemicus]HEL0116297.1 MFS transporter [Streptococcus equi subsp. zooepidemicus]HEL0118326.1 MFS transporter [Streptococcus equi subsp. zooepidemicus]